MPKRKKIASGAIGDGPYLSAALFCDQIIEERDGTLSAIRIIDTMTLRIPHEVPEDQPFPLQVSFLLIFKTGNAAGTHQFRIDLRSPTGKIKRGPTEDHEFLPQPHGGVNFRVKLGIEVKKSGIFWADVYLDGKPIAHAPFNIVVEREPEIAAQKDASANVKKLGSRQRKAKKTEMP